MNRIYVPYPIEVVLKVFSWITVIIIDIIDLILKPFMMIGLRCSAIFAIVSALFCGYTHFVHHFTIGQSFLMFGALLALFAAFLGAVHLIDFVLAKIRPPFLNIIFETVVVSFRRPCLRSKAKRQLFKTPPDNK